FNQPHLVD
ncbi:hypothetical protein D030_1664B, partial [Vibrio parahaemolyticus AQ3810]